MNILLTNDDSYDSPLFHILYDSLTKLGHKLTCVMPATEQSWKGKSMTRFGKLTLESKSINGRDFMTFSGTPADCINFGIYNHSKENKPDLIISGINLGYNASLGYLFSSGTVGAAMEGYLAGFPALSLSQKLNREEYSHWNESREFREETRIKYTALIQEVLTKLEHEFKSLLSEKALWMLEMPDHLHSDWQIVHTYPSLQHYGSTFAKDEDGSYIHACRGLNMEDEQGTDVHAIANGHVALNKLDFRDQLKK